MPVYTAQTGIDGDIHSANSDVSRHTLCGLLAGRLPGPSTDRMACVVRRLVSLLVECPAWPGGWSVDWSVDLSNVLRGLVAGKLTGQLASHQATQGIRPDESLAWPGGWSVAWSVD